MTSTSFPFSLSSYTLHRSLGSGNVATVYQSTPKSAPSQPLAIKIIPSPKVNLSVLREVALHFPLSHPNIVPLIKVTTAHHPNTPPALSLVMPAAQRDMFSEVATAGCLPPKVVRKRLLHIAKALHYLHENQILHLDVKLENVVLTNGTAQLIDFGCARSLAVKQPVDTPLGGTLQYIPPELVTNPSHPPAPTFDAWSLGVLAYTALLGCYPFNGATTDASDLENDRNTRSRIRNKPPHPVPSCVDLPPDLRRLVFGLLHKDPLKRCTIPQVIAELQPSQTSRFSSRPTPPVYTRPTLNPHTPALHHQRPASPASTADADFGDRAQTIEQAIAIVEHVQKERCKAQDQLWRCMPRMPRRKDISNRECQERERLM